MTIKGKARPPAASKPASERHPGIHAIFSIGHSTLEIKRFIRILKTHQVTVLADIRSIPGSKRNPQFNMDSLSNSLRQDGIEYVHFRELGGFRRPTPNSINTGWRNISFRGYADHMRTEEFQSGIARLVEMSKDETVAVMCAEGNPFRCHRTILADALTLRGVKVIDISGGRSGNEHVLTPFAVVEDKLVTYPDESHRFEVMHGGKETWRIRCQEQIVGEK